MADPKVMLFREKEGRCATCGIQTHKIKRKLFGKKRTALDIDGLVSHGVCLRCNGPDKSAQNTSTTPAVPEPVPVISAYAVPDSDAPPAVSCASTTDTATTYPPAKVPSALPVERNINALSVLQSTPSSIKEQKKAETAINAGNYTEAIIHCTSALGQDPDNAKMLLLRCLAYIQLKQNVFARYDAQRAIELQPNVAVGHQLLANALLLTEQYHEAVQHARECVALDPNNSEGYKFLMTALFVTDPTSFEVITYARKYVSLQPDQNAGHYVLAMAFLMKNEFTEVKEHAQKMMNIDPQNAEGYKIYAAAVFGEDNFIEAEYYARKCVELDPRSADGHKYLCCSLMNNEKHQECVLFSQKYVELDPQNAMAQNMLATAFAGVGRYQEAIDRYQYVINNIDPNNELAKNGAQEALRKMLESQQGIPWS